MAEDMGKLYELLTWRSSPRSDARRFLGYYRLFRRMLRFEPLNRLLRKSFVKIADLCSGAGIAGFAMAKALEDEGVKAELMLVDLRCEALRRGLDYRADSALLHAVSMDIRGWIALRERQLDLELICGASMAHFDPFEMHRVLASASLSLAGDGILVIEELDRLKRVLLGTGYHYVWPEPSERPVVSVHRGYDPGTSMVVRVLVDLVSGESVEHRVSMFWTPALIASFAQVYFYRVELALLDDRGFVIAFRPRESFTPRHGLESRAPPVREMQF